MVLDLMIQIEKPWLGFGVFVGSNFGLGMIGACCILVDLALGCMGSGNMLGFWHSSLGWLYNLLFRRNPLL